jgi:multicomponent Na+:H+ antiporter subunit F
MKILRWLGGLVIIAAFLYYNFFIYDGNLLLKLVNISMFCALFVLFRVIFGPSSADRIVAVDILGILIIGMLALFGLYYDQNFFLDIALIWALLSFIASLAFAKILEGRQLDD